MPGYENPNRQPGQGERAQRLTFGQHLFGGGQGLDLNEVERLIRGIEARIPADKRGMVTPGRDWNGTNENLAREFNLPVKAIAALRRLYQVREAIQDPNSASGGERNRGVYNALDTGYSDEYIDAYNDAVDYVSAATAEEITAQDAAMAEGRRRDVNNQIQTFIDDMTGPSRSNDPIRMGLLRAGVDSAQAAAGAAGIDARSGLAGTQAASLGQANLLPYETQRASLRQQGLGVLNQRDLTQQQMDDAWASMMLARQDKASEAAWAGQMNSAQGLGGAIGTGLGALGFIGGPAVGAATMSAGGALGGGLASLGAPQAPTYTQGPPRGRGRGNSGGGTGW